MNHRTAAFVLGGFFAILGGVSCRHGDAATPPPDAQRPQIRSQAELAAAREEAVRVGQVVPATQPVYVDAEKQATSAPVSRAAPPPPIVPGAVQADILLVDNDAVTVAELLYDLRDEIPKLRKAQTRTGFREQITRLVRRACQEDIGRLLVYREAISKLPEEQNKQLEKAVQIDIDERVAKEFDGSMARFKAHLQRYGLTLDQCKARVQRRLVVQQYTYETLRPQLNIRRDELLSYYHKNIKKYSSEETRELLLIEAPFEKFLIPPAPWSTAAPQVQAQARLRAVRQIRDAHEALANTPFDQVAREYSRGLHADDGGSWGQIGRPLQGTYETLSRWIFTASEGQLSEPIETPTGWYIVKCGKVEPARQVAFTEAQEQIRRELSERRFNELAGAYIMRLADKATLSSFDPFVKEAVRRASAPDWPGPELPTTSSAAPG